MRAAFVSEQISNTNTGFIFQLLMMVCKTTADGKLSARMSLNSSGNTTLLQFGVEGGKGKSEGQSWSEQRERKKKDGQIPGSQALQMARIKGDDTPLTKTLSRNGGKKKSAGFSKWIPKLRVTQSVFSPLEGNNSQSSFSDKTGSSLY